MKHGQPLDIVSQLVPLQGEGQGRFASQRPVRSAETLIKGSLPRHPPKIHASSVLVSFCQGFGTSTRTDSTSDMPFTCDRFPLYLFSPSLLDYPVFPLAPKVCHYEVEVAADILWYTRLHSTPSVATGRAGFLAIQVPPTCE
jgi:hypothetical protein